MVKILHDLRRNHLHPCFFRTGELFVASARRASPPLSYGLHCNRVLLRWPLHCLCPAPRDSLGGSFAFLFRGASVLVFGMTPCRVLVSRTLWVPQRRGEDDSFCIVRSLGRQFMAVSLAGRPMSLCVRRCVHVEFHGDLPSGRDQVSMVGTLGRHPLGCVGFC